MITTYNTSNFDVTDKGGYKKEISNGHVSFIFYGEFSHTRKQSLTSTSWVELQT